MGFAKLFLLLLNDDLEPPVVEDTTEPDSPVDATNMLLTGITKYFHLSRAVLEEPPTPRTLHILGRVQQLQVTMLIDSGSSHNIMQPRVAEFLSLPRVVLETFSIFIRCTTTNLASIDAIGNVSLEFNH